MWADAATIFGGHWPRPMKTRLADRSRGLSAILCAGPVYPSRRDEPVCEDDGELGFRGHHHRLHVPSFLASRRSGNGRTPLPSSVILALIFITSRYDFRARAVSHGINQRRAGTGSRSRISTGCSSRSLGKHNSSLVFPVSSSTRTPWPRCGLKLASTATTAAHGSAFMWRTSSRSILTNQ